MNKSNFERMLELADEAFDVRNDPDQLDVNENVLEKLRTLHPATVSEYADEKGPAAWILLIPTTALLMRRFLDKEISEKELFDNTSAGTPCNCVYLCSAMVLEEYRGRGIAKKLSIAALKSIGETHRIDSLFVWAFSGEGKSLARNIAAEMTLPLFFR